MNHFGRALAAVEGVMRRALAAGKYPNDQTWKAVDSSEHVEHARVHLVSLEGGDTSEPHLEHAATRLLMALEVTRMAREHKMLDRRMASVISLLQQYPEIYNLLRELDKAGSGFLFGDPTHTISYNIALRAQAGDPLAKAACQALNALSPDHCAWALSNESSTTLPVT